MTQAVSGAVIIATITALCSCFTTPLNQGKDAQYVEEFLIHLLNNKFGNCSLLLINIQEKDLKETPLVDFEQIVRHNKHDAFVMQFDNQFGKASNGAPGTYYYNTPTVSEVSMITKFESLLDVHRFRHSCTVALFALSSHFNELVGDTLFQTIKTWSNVIKKDEDFYIFAGSGHLSTENEVLISSDIGQGIKFKIFVQPQVQSNDTSLSASSQFFKVSTTCFYCSFGKPKSVIIHWGHIINRNSTSVQASLLEMEPLTTLFPDFSKNFHGKILQVGTPTGTRWLNEIRLENGKWVAKRGLYKIVMNNLMLRYNFSADFFPSMVNGGTGSKLKNGTWVGSVGNIVHKTSDLGHVTGQTYARNKVVGFTYPVSYEMLTFTSGEPLPYFSWKAILWPLSRDIWIGLGLSFILANVILFLIVKRTQEKFDVTHIISYTFASVLEQDVPSAERLSANPIRAFVCFWLFFTLVISTAYRSKLVSLLSFPNVEQPPATFEELATSDYDYALQYLRGAAYVLLQTSPNPTYKTIFNRMELESDDVKCFQRVIGTRFVCISWSRIADFIFKRNLSDQYGRLPVVKAPVTTCFLSVGIIMEKRAIFLSNFNSIIIRSTDAGLLEKWWFDDMNWVYNERRVWEKASNKTQTSNPVGQTTDALTNKHFRGSYYLLACGSLFGGFTFIWERLLYRKQLVVKSSFPILN